MHCTSRPIRTGNIRDPIYHSLYFTLCSWICLFTCILSSSYLLQTQKFYNKSQTTKSSVHSKFISIRFYGRYCPGIIFPSFLSLLSFSSGHVTGEICQRIKKTLTRMESTSEGNARTRGSSRKCMQERSAGKKTQERKGMGLLSFPCCSRLLAVLLPFSSLALLSSYRVFESGCILSYSLSFFSLIFSSFS